MRNEIETLVQQRLDQMNLPPVPPGYPPVERGNNNQPGDTQEGQNQKSNPLWRGSTLDKKLAMVNLSEFNGSNGDWLKWSRRVKASFGGAGLVKLLTSQEMAQANQEANERVYWLLEGVTVNGAAKTTVTKYQDMKSGFDAWKNLLIT